MSLAIGFKTSKFDVSKEDENPNNPIYGQSLLIWLEKEVSDELSFDEPDAEDWGWYSLLEWKGREYLLGATAYFEDGDDPTSELEWVFQVDKHRSFTEKLLGREKMTETDECLQYFKSIFENHNEFNNVTLE